MQADQRKSFSTKTAEQLWQSLSALPLADTVRPPFGGRPFADLAELWFPDPRKDRAMRACGVSDALIGSGSDFERCEAYLSILPRLVGSPLYAAACSDLLALGCDCSVGEDAELIWQSSAHRLRAHPLTPDMLLEEVGVAQARLDLADPPSTGEARLCPVLGLDRLLCLQKRDLAAYLERLSARTGEGIDDLEGLSRAISLAIGHHASCGAAVILADLSHYTCFERPNPYRTRQILAAVLAGASPSEGDRAHFTAQMLRLVGRECRAHDMRLLLRITRESDTVGPPFSVEAVGKLLHYLNESGALPTTALLTGVCDLLSGVLSLCNAAPSGEESPRVLLALEGEYADGEACAEAVSFLLRHDAAPYLIGLISDTKSAFSHPVTWLFRQELCEQLGRWAEQMSTPPPLEVLLDTAERIAYRAAEQFFGR